jgi:hypothetical protein
MSSTYRRSSMMKSSLPCASTPPRELSVVISYSRLPSRFPA